MYLKVSVKKDGSQSIHKGAVLCKTQPEQNVTAALESKAHITTLQKKREKNQGKKAI